MASDATPARNHGMSQRNLLCVAFALFTIVLVNLLTSLGMSPGISHNDRSEIEMLKRHYEKSEKGLQLMLKESEEKIEQLKVEIKSLKDRAIKSEWGKNQEEEEEEESEEEESPKDQANEEEESEEEEYDEEEKEGEKDPKEEAKETVKTKVEKSFQEVSEKREKLSQTKNPLEDRSITFKNIEAPRKKSRKPMNILLLYADDWRYDTLGIAGNKVVKTPYLDQLARNGIRFSHNCVTTSVCWVSRATLLSGLYLARHKTDMPQVWHGDWKKCIYYILKKAGYSVAHVGKWGIWDLPQPLNLDYEKPDEGWHYEERDGRLWHITEKNEHDALEFLSTRDPNKPFFLNVAYYATHAMDGEKEQYFPQNRSMSMYVNDTIPVPKTATEEAWQKMPYFFNEGNEGRNRYHWRYDSPRKHQHMMKQYYRMASEVDTASGSILKLLEKQGELNNTLVIFTTDNGNFHAEHGLADKWYPHQESIRVPLIVMDPRMKEDLVGTVNDEFTLNIDLAPTILSAAGLTPPKTYMGRDMADLYVTKQKEKAAPWRTEFFYEHPIHLNKNFIPASEALVRKKYKYFYWPDHGFEQLFDLAKDPLEEHDIFNSTKSSHKKVLKEMKSRFRYLKKLVHSSKIVTL